MSGAQARHAEADEVDCSRIVHRGELVYESPLIACRYSPAGDRVAASAQNQRLAIWNLHDPSQAGQSRIELIGHDAWVNALQFSQDGQVLISAGCDGQLVWWDLSGEQPAIVRTVQGHQGWIRALALSPDGLTLASAGNDGSVKLWSLAEGNAQGELLGHQKHVYSLAFAPDGALVSGDLGGVIRQWDPELQTEVRQFDGSKLHSYNGGQGVDFGGVRSLAVSADGSRLIAGGLQNASNPLGAVHDPLVLVFDWESGQLQRSLETGDLKGVICRVLFVGERWIAGASGGSSGGFLLFWNSDQDKDTHRVKLPHLARDMDLKSDGQSFAHACFDQRLHWCGLAPESA